jgi:flagellar basal-body rod modification protein FlgD
MSTTAIAATTAQVSQAGAAAAAAPSGALDENAFLRLLTAQLQNQDPLSPMDPQQLTAQLAQLSSLEQLTGINTRLDKLSSQESGTTTAALISLIGKQVTFDGSQLSVKGGAAPETQYNLTAPASKVTATISDSTGKVVRTIEIGAQGVGAQKFQFDGKNANGVPLPDGTYTLAIAATPVGGGSATPVSLATTAPVDGVDFSGNTPALLVGTLRLGLDQVRDVRTPTNS